MTISNDNEAADGDDMVRADPRHRKQCLAALGIVTILAIGLFLWIMPFVAGQASGDNPAQAAQTLRWSMTALFLPCFAFAGYLTYLSRRIARAGQYPPPGMAVVKDTRISRGADAVKLSWLMMACAVGLALVGLIGGYWMPWVVFPQLLKH